MSDSQIIVQADKTVVKITGLNIKGLNTTQLEDILTEKLVSMVRIIGVTGTSIEMDIYGLDDSCIIKDEIGIIKAVSLAEGITASEVAQISFAQKITEIDYSNIPPKLDNACMKERWL